MRAWDGGPAPKLMRLGDAELPFHPVVRSPLLGAVVVSLRRRPLLGRGGSRLSGLFGGGGGRSRRSGALSRSGPFGGGDGGSRFSGPFGGGGGRSRRSGALSRSGPFGVTTGDLVSKASSGGRRNIASFGCILKFGPFGVGGVGSRFSGPFGGGGGGSRRSGARSFLGGSPGSRTGPFGRTSSSWLRSVS